jgi:hypothetical protein
MIDESNVTFRTVEAPFQTPQGEERRTVDIIELAYPGGTVGAFPVDEIDPETGKKWRDTYANKYGAFKRDPDGERKSQLQREIAERQAELDAMKAKPREADEAAPDFANMSEDDLRKWIADNGGDEQRSNASHATLVHVAEGLQAKAVRKRARAAARTEAE